MGPLGFLLGLPTAPMRGLLRITEILRDQAEQQLHSTASARADLEEIAAKREAGEISPEEERKAMHQVSRRVVGSPNDES